MSIADQAKLRALEARVAELERQYQELLALVTAPKPDKPKRG